MAKEVKGFLAPDGKFFSDKWECDRYTYQQQIENMCDTHNVNAENFLSLLNSWHEAIKGYYNADRQCKQKQANGSGPTFTEWTESFPQASEHPADTGVRDKDTPGFLEQSFGGDK